MTNERYSSVVMKVVVAVAGVDRWRFSQAPIPSQGFQKVCAAMVVFLECSIGVVRPGLE